MEGNYTSFVGVCQQPKFHYDKFKHGYLDYMGNIMAKTI